MEVIGELGDGLRVAPDFEAASDALLRAGRRLLRSMIAGRGIADIRRGSVHLFPQTARVAVHADTAHAPPLSRTVWALIRAHGRPLVLSAQSGQATLFLETGVEVRQLGRGQTRQAMLERDVSHLHATPLFGPAGAIGVLVFEVAYHALIDFEEIDDDPDFLERSMTLAQMTAGRFALLPRRSLTDALCDAFVPVASAHTLSLLRHLDRYVERRDPVVLRGPVGSGRTHLARWCHARSGRRGAFEIFDPMSAGDQIQALGAAWVAAQHGTLLIRRPERLNADAQARLLAWMASDSADAPRLILRAEPAWSQAVEQGRFDPELTMRVQDLVVAISPLRDRPEEIVAWARHFALRAGGRVTFSDDARRFLHARAWQDNLIGLNAVVRQARDRALEAALGGDGTAVIERCHLAAVPYLHHGVADQARLEARLLEGVDAAASVLVEAGRLTEGAKIEGMVGLVLWRYALRVGGREAALTLLGRTPSTGNAARTWRRKIGPAVALARQLGMDTLAAALEEA